MGFIGEIYNTIIVSLSRGFLFTIYLTVISATLALIVGFISGTIKFSRIPVIHQLITLYIYIIRGTPPLLVIFIVFYVLPYLGVTLSSFEAAVLSLVVHEGAYMTEIVRSGLETIEEGQHEAAHALGLNYIQKLRYVILPQSIKIMLPPLASQLVLLIKTTALVSLIAITELTRAGRLLTQRGVNPFLTFGFVALFYFVLCYPVLNFSDRLERRFLYE